MCFVKRPEYACLQCQKVILNQHLKVPPALAQFSFTLDKNTAIQLFKLLNKYRPETTAEKKVCLEATAAAVADDKRDVNPYFSCSVPISILHHRRPKSLSLSITA